MRWARRRRSMSFYVSIVNRERPALAKLEA
jgi:hypothetical protein